MVHLSFISSIRKDSKGQVIIVLALFISILLAELSLVYTQNILAGTTTSNIQLTFPKYTIENLRHIAIVELKEYIRKYNPSVPAFQNYVASVNDQINRIYAQHGCYASITLVGQPQVFGNSIVAYRVNIVFFNKLVYYDDTEIVYV